MMNRMDSARLIGLLVGVALALGPSSAWSQIPGRSFRSANPSRVIPAENVVPIEDSLRASPRPSGAEAFLADEPQPAVAEPAEPRALLAETEPIEPKVAWRPARGASKAPQNTKDSAVIPPSRPVQQSTDESGPTGSGETDKEGVSGLVKGEVRQVWKTVLYYWNYKFYESSDKKVNLSLQVIVVGLLLIFVGHIVARRLSIWLGGSVLKRVGLPPATAAPLQKMAYYAMFAVFAIFSMNSVGLSWDALTFLGGALAIGIGFGSQNVMNNFISGLILIIERPIRVGDVIQIESHSGKVSEIGARSTRITTGSNLEVIIPNSTFLQGNVVNWTLSDDVISSKVTVGVAYGSPAREVAKLLKQAAEEHDKIMKTPVPGVSFTEFAADSMQFELTFWLKMSQADRGKVESDLRFKIDELFATRGIVIAYPQRDVHLNLMRPVEVRLSESTVTPRELRGAA